tara:strand:+ start:383 stop:499 length:117 start_codon:yes stop_codon:yes gene_type:complete
LVVLGSGKGRHDFFSVYWFFLFVFLGFKDFKDFKVVGK